MHAFFDSAEVELYRNFRHAYLSGTPAILHGHATPDQVQDFAKSVAYGLDQRPRRLECRFLYDLEGSTLFERITQQPEYYLTRSETSILAACSSRIRELTGPVSLIELGSGYSRKTEYLLRALLDGEPGGCYVPVDVSESALSAACAAITEAHPGVNVIGMNCEYEEAFPVIGQLSPALVLLLGSTLGNLDHEEMSNFLMSLGASMRYGDFFLLGIDLVKEPRQLEAAYNDAAGVTRNFTRNLFARMNRELGSNIDLESIEHVARYHPEHEQIETYARFTRQQTIFLAPLARRFTLHEGEMVRIEISRKFRLEHFVPYLDQFGFCVEESFTDEQNWFALLLLRRRPTQLPPP
jgi:L-histidine Nalpha-methyltransferase